jgi:hypothetical protein
MLNKLIFLYIDKDFRYKKLKKVLNIISTAFTYYGNQFSLKNLKLPAQIKRARFLYPAP